MQIPTSETQAVAKPASSNWFKGAIIYQLHIKTFCDANNDGIGDFQGLLSKLDYLRDLGVTAIWLLPFYPSPLRDDGYDISDYADVHPSYGTLRDFREFVRECHRRNLRVITELVVNHTSDQHPWFQRARRAKPGSVHRDYYVWSDTDQRYKDPRVIFLDTEKSNWTWDGAAGAQGSDQRAALLARDGRRRVPARRGAVSGGARGHQQREPARDPRHPEE